MKWLVDIIYFDDSKVRLDKLWIAASFTYFVSFEFNYQVSIREGQKEESLPGCLIISFIGRTILNFSPLDDGEKLPVSHSPHTTSASNPKYINHHHWLVIHMFVMQCFSVFLSNLASKHARWLCSETSLKTTLKNTAKTLHQKTYVN